MNNYNITFSCRTSTAALVSVLFSVCALLFARLKKKYIFGSKSRLAMVI